MTNLHRILLLGTFLMGSGIALGEDADRSANKVQAFEANFKTCQKFLKSYCGTQKWEACAAKKDEKSVRVVQCINELVSHKDKINDENSRDLNPNFQTLVKEFKGRAGDNESCLKTATLVCGEGATFKECFERQPGKFPSYCRGMVTENLNKMDAAYKNDPELKGCADDLVSQCQAALNELANENVSSQKQIMAQMNKYQACLKAAIPKRQACRNLVEVNKEKAVAPTVQKIGN